MGRRRAVGGPRRTGPPLGAHGRGGGVGAEIDRERRVGRGRLGGGAGGGAGDRVGDGCGRGVEPVGHRGRCQVGQVERRRGGGVGRRHRRQAGIDLDPGVETGCLRHEVVGDVEAAVEVGGGSIGHREVGCVRHARLESGLGFGGETVVEVDHRVEVGRRRGGLGRRLGLGSPLATLCPRLERGRIDEGDRLAPVDHERLPETIAEAPVMDVATGEQPTEQSGQEPGEAVDQAGDGADQVGAQAGVLALRVHDPESEEFLARRPPAVGGQQDEEQQPGQQRHRDGQDRACQIDDVEGVAALDQAVERPPQHVESVDVGSRVDRVAAEVVDVGGAEGLELGAGDEAGHETHEPEVDQGREDPATQDIGQGRREHPSILAEDRP